jgi:uncharacterized cupredoxin-like copper-binding protein
VIRIAPNATTCTGVLALALPLFAAASSGASEALTPPTAQALQIQVKDFAIKAPERLRAGTIALHVRNAGPDTHELILVRADGRPLPLRSDNLTVDEDAIKARTVGSVDKDQPGSERVLKVTLRPGRYVLFCNMSGHYLGGMHTRLVVR